MTKPDNTGRGKNENEHALADHDYGIFSQHTHERGQHYDHDHDEDFDGGPLEDNPLWQQDNIFLSTVGIDVGSSSTQVVFSQIHLKRQGEALSSRYVVVDRRLLYQSPIFFTPYLDGMEIDATALGALVDQAYGEASITPNEVDIGVVLLTGEALKRLNARTIAHVIAHKGGDFLSASAGHHMEANLAAHGSGAVELSGKESSFVLNVDIGGGTTKLTLIKKGSVIQTAAFHIGGRLLVWDEQNVMTRVEPRALELLSEIADDLAVGSPISQETVDHIGKALAEIVVDVVKGHNRSDAKWLTEPIILPNELASIVFSGGVSEYIADPDLKGHNDVGLCLGRSIKNIISESQIPQKIVASAGGIRATALGASEFNIQVSGNTGYISDPGVLLPRKNMPVIRLVIDSDSLSSGLVELELVRSIESFDLTDYEQYALAFEWSGEFDYVLLKKFCEAIYKFTEIESLFAPGNALYLLFDRDLAQSVGRILTQEYDLKCPLLVLDGLRFKEFEFVDLGRVRLPSRTVPVTVKSLLFQSHGMS